MIILLCVLLFTSTLTQGYDTKLSIELAYMSLVTFEPLDQISSWTCAPCQNYLVQDVKSFINTTLDIQGFVGYSPAHHAIIAAFRGSVDIQNWLANVDVVQVSYPRCNSCKVHKGFYDAYKMVASYVNSQITYLNQKYDNPKIFTTGHSLGGALAVMAATEIKGTFGRLDLVYTTGQPRVGNSYYADHLNTHFILYRLVHWADVVPHSPASGIVMAFKHGGTEVWYTEDMQSYKVCASEDKSCANSIGMMSRNTKDHSLVNYYLKLKVELWKENLRQL